ncbi:MAG: 4Fe-4S dicluster domain-containing protein [Anaerolineaceae bacterium]|jgi:ferredoxin|nr:4Fe-4S dicluster domain-containing protein [Anaerolineaceae bacterium]
MTDNQQSTKTEKFSLANLRDPIIIGGVFYIVAVVLWLATGHLFYLFNFVYIGTSIVLGIGLFAALPRKKKNIGRKVAQFLVGGYMLIFLGLIQRENMQLEGFFFYLLSGLFAGSVIHYLVAKVFGPLIFNRGWCGWACWTAAVLDLMPFNRKLPGRHPILGRLRFIHFFASLVLVFVLWFILDYRPGSQSNHELYWLLAGNAFYYLTAIALAIGFKDNRAFCKYLCPIPTLQKITSRFSLLKISGPAEDCTNCGACVRACPMDIRVSDYIQNNQRVLSSECIFCLECVNACPHQILDTSFAFDFAWQENLRYQDK